MPSRVPAGCSNPASRPGRVRKVPLSCLVLLALATVVGGSAQAESPLSASLERLLEEISASTGRDVISTQSTLPAAAATTSSSAPAVNPRAGQPMRFVHINSRAAPGGDGTYERPFRSLSEYEQLPASQRSSYDVIYVHGGGPQQVTSTLQLDSHQRLLSNAVPHTVTAAQGTFALPGFNAAAPKPTLLNLNGGDILALGNASEVSGFRFNGSSTGSAIVGTNVTGFNINRNDFVGGFNGVALTTSTPGGTLSRGILAQNTFENSLNDGFQLTHFGPGMLDLDVSDNTVIGSGGIAFNIASSGAPMNARILRNRTSGSGTGLVLTAIDGGAIDATVEGNQFDDSTGTTGVSALGLNRAGLRTGR